MKTSDSNWLRTMFCIVDLQYPCFDTDFISPAAMTKEREVCHNYMRFPWAWMAFSKMHT